MKGVGQMVLLAGVRASLPSIFRRLGVGPVNAFRLTPRAADDGIHTAKNEFILALSFFRFGDESSPTHRR
jgi:hypothetical protein